MVIIEILKIKSNFSKEEIHCNNTFAPKKAYFLGNFLWNIALGKGHYL
jgi:hypothetical protein